MKFNCRLPKDFYKREYEAMFEKIEEFRRQRYERGKLRIYVHPSYLEERPVNTLWDRWVAFVDRNRAVEQQKYYYYGVEMIPDVRVEGWRIETYR